MKTLSISVFIVMTVSAAIAGPESKPVVTPAVCKADLRTWSVQRTETLTIAQITTRMNEMYACADQEKRHEKQMRAYLDEFYRTHSELANRTFDFIVRHGLQEQFGEEENRAVAEAKSDSKN
jgi:hypothetical protein